jgi:Secretion system C-terminal sorting domain
MNNSLRLCRILVGFLLIILLSPAFGQGYVDLTSGTSTPWPDGALQRVFPNVGTSFPPVTVTATISERTSALINATPRNDPRGLWLNADFASRTNLIKITFTFSEPVTNLSFGIRGLDRELTFSNYQDRVAIEGYDDKGVGVTPSLKYDPFKVYETDGISPNIKVLQGYGADDFDSTLSTVSFKGAGIKQITLTYDCGRDVRLGEITAQGIYLTGLSWANIVPVQLMYLKGKADNNRTQLNWATATELNSDYFSVQRSVDLKEFAELGQVKAAGNSKLKLEYGFLDEAPLPGINYYRLKQIDKDGSAEYSKIVAVNVKGDGTQFAIYPNPSDGQTIQLQFSDLELDGLSLVDMVGREVPFKISSSSSSSVTLSPLRELCSGIYFVTYNDTTLGKARVTKKLIVSK